MGKIDYVLLFFLTFVSIVNSAAMPYFGLYDQFLFIFRLVYETLKILKKYILQLSNKIITNKLSSDNMIKIIM